MLTSCSPRCKSERDEDEEDSELRFQFGSDLDEEEIREIIEADYKCWLDKIPKMAWTSMTSNFNGSFVENQILGEINDVM